LAHASAPAGQTLRTKYRTWSQFYVVTFAYMYITRVLVQLMEATLPFRVFWVSSLAEELITVTYYVFVGYGLATTDVDGFGPFADPPTRKLCSALYDHRTKLRPTIDNQYLEVRTNEEEEEQEVIPMESFGTITKRSNAAATAATLNAGQYD